MRDDLLRELLPRLKRDYGFKEKGSWLQEGKCEECDKREVYARAEAPWVLRCGRANKCGAEVHVKDRYPDLFDNWSNRFRRTESNPHAAADAYLEFNRGFDLRGLRGAYSQELYRDDDRRITTATVRFPLPWGGYWERLIDQPSRFEKKARFSFGSSFSGHWWRYPATSIEQLAMADEIWLVEGIFDAIALQQHGGVNAVSLMSCNNYPETALAELRRVCGALGVAGPRLIFAFDVGAAGVSFCRKFVERAREDGWRASAAQVRPDGEGDKRDWNDLAQLDRLKPEDLAEYRWAGEVTIAPNATEKAMLLYDRDKRQAFPFTFATRQLWATFSLERIQAAHAAMMESQDAEFLALPFEKQWNRAAREAVDIEELANCTFRTLYFQKDAYLEEGAYYLRVDFPAKRPSIKATFTGAACAAGAEFKKRLASIAPGAQWTGSTPQLDKLMAGQWATIRMVEAIQHTGYSREHEAWIFGTHAVHKGRVFEPNDEDYFVLGKRSVKLRTSDRMLKVHYDAERLNLGWVPNLAIAFRAKGLVTLAFWVLALFAEQIRAEQDSLAFLELSGEPGTGKTTLIEFLWKLVGRPSYEGFDPTKATNAGIARSLGQVGNLPVVLLEGDRTQDTPHARRFEWDELKTAYNGRAVRTRAVANGGMETFEPPFRGAIIVAQNAPIEASDAMTERLMGIHFDKSHFSAEGKAAADALSAMPLEEISGFPVHIARREEAILTAYRQAYAGHVAAMNGRRAGANGRLVHNHAQLAAMLDAMRVVIGNLDGTAVAEAHDLIRFMLDDRHQKAQRDHANVLLFWERFDAMAANDAATINHPNPINHSRKADLVAVNLVQFEQRCGDMKLRWDCSMNDLKRQLKTSKARKFLGTRVVNSVTGKSVSCWVFKNPASQN